MAGLLVIFGLLIIFILVARRLPDVPIREVRSSALSYSRARKRFPFKLPSFKFPSLQFPSGLIDFLKRKPKIIPKPVSGRDDFWESVKKTSHKEELRVKEDEKQVEKEELISSEAVYQADVPLSHSCSPLVQSDILEADRLFEEEKFRLAERRYLEIAARDPKCVHVLNRLGIIFLEQNGELEDAEQAFRTALKFAPGNGFLLHNLGLTLYRQGKHSEAAYFLEKSVEGGSRIANRYANLGICYMALRQYNKAVSALRKALALNRENQRIKELLEEAKEKAERHKKLLS